MKDRMRRLESGKMLLDVSKYFSTVTGVGSLAGGSVNWRLAVVGLFMAFVAWVVGFFMIPKDEGTK